MGHLRKSLAGHLLKGSGGHLVRGCVDTAISYVLSQCTYTCDPAADCDGSEADIVTTPALSNLHDSNIGKVIKISGYTECWKVSEGFDATGAVSVTKTNSYDDCEDCCQDSLCFTVEHTTAADCSYPQEEDLLEYDFTFEFAGATTKVCSKSWSSGCSSPYFTFNFTDEFEVCSDGYDTYIFHYAPDGAAEGESLWEARLVSAGPLYDRYDLDYVEQDNCSGFIYDGTPFPLYISVQITSNPCNPLP